MVRYRLDFILAKIGFTSLQKVFHTKRKWVKLKKFEDDKLRIISHSHTTTNISLSSTSGVLSYSHHSKLKKSDEFHRLVTNILNFESLGVATVGFCSEKLIFSLVVLVLRFTLSLCDYFNFLTF